jgi:hypothetical protein
MKRGLPWAFGENPGLRALLFYDIMSLQQGAALSMVLLTFD